MKVALQQVGLALLYALIAKVVLLHFSANGIVSIIWPSSGLALAALLLGGKRYAWGVLFGALIGNLWSGTPASASIFISLGNTLEALTGVWLLTKDGTFQSSLQSQRSYLRLAFLAAGLGSFVAAIIGSTTLFALSISSPENYLHNLVYWWMGDALGIILVTPFVLIWRNFPYQWLSPKRLPEAVLIFGLSLVACIIIFLGWGQATVGNYSKGFLMFLFVTMAAIRFGKHGVLLVLAMTASFALYGAVHGSGYFANDIASTNLTGYWLYLVILTFVGMMLGTYIVENRRAIEKLSKNEAHFRFMLETSPIAVRIAASAGHKVLFANERYAKLINSSADQVTGKDPKQYYANPQDYEDIHKDVHKGVPVTDRLVELSIPGGITRWTMASYLPLEFEGESAVLGWFYDVTDLRQTQEALRLSEQFAMRSLEELRYQKFALDKHAIVAVTDVQGRITYANEKFCEISGYSADELIGQDHAILNSGYHPKGFFKEMYRIVASGRVWHAEVCNRAKDGHLYWVDTTIAPYIGQDGKPQSYISIRTDITQRVAAEEKSNFLALYDPLTNLPNRRLLLDRLKLALATSARNGKEGAVLFIDLDDFKTLNDTLGHDIGDLLLQQVAERLLASVREGDTVSRLGGDEFVVMLEDLGAQDEIAAAQAERIGNKILEALNQPYRLAEHTHISTPSIGITLFNDHERGIEELLKQADIAMYQAKKSGRNALCFFDPKVQEAISVRAGMAKELRSAINGNQFQLHYQIQVNGSGHPLGAEVLIRWQHPERGLVPPFNFIPLAEETGLIVPIGQWVLETACKQLKIWESSSRTRDLTLSVNVSAKQFRQTDFVEQVKATIERHGIRPNRLKLEPTESLLLENVESTIFAMNALKQIGIQFSLDDFGTGYSSLQYLKRLPLDQLKIDQSFVRDIVFDSNDKAIVTTIIAMARSLGLDVIAEGVETDQQRQLLLENDCSHFQGYLFSKPVPLEEFEALLK